MTARRGYLLGFGAVAIAITALIGWQLYQMRDPCMTGSGGACPSLADVRGIRYYVSSPRELDLADGEARPYGAIDQTNVSELKSTTVYKLNDIDAEVLLLAPVYGESVPPGVYWLLNGDVGPFTAELCKYLTDPTEYEQCA